MEWFALPDNTEGAKWLLPSLKALAPFAILVLFYGNWRFTGIAPKGAQEWRRVHERLLAIVALFSPIAAVYGSVAMFIGFAAIVFLLVVGTIQTHIRIIVWMAFILLVTYTLLFPHIHGRSREHELHDIMREIYRFLLDAYHYYGGISK